MTARDYAIKINELFSDIETYSDFESLYSHLLDEVDEFKHGNSRKEQALELVDVIILAYRLIEEMGFNVDEIVEEKGNIVLDRLRVANAIWSIDGVNIEGDKAYALAKSALQ